MVVSVLYLCRYSGKMPSCPSLWIAPFYLLNFHQFHIQPRVAFGGMTHSTLGELWVGLIEEAEEWRDGVEFDNYDETLKFICYTLERSRRLGTDEKKRS